MSLPGLSPEAVTASGAELAQDFSRIPVDLRTGGESSARAIDGSDALEQEAERVADQVLAAGVSPGVRSAPPQIQRSAEQPAGPSVHPAPASVDRVLAGSGSPLDSALRHDMERRFGHDFSRVQVHAGTAAEASALQLDAAAYTVNHNIVFGPGRFAPSTPVGRRLIAHELTHVVQQRHTNGSRVLRQPETRRAPGMRQGTAEDRRVFAEDVLHFLEGQAELFAMQPQRDASVILGHLQSTVRGVLTTFAGDDALAPILERIRAAYSSGVRTVLMSRTVARPGVTGTPPTLDQLYEQHRNEILPFALPARADTGADELSVELGAPLPRTATTAQRTRHAAMETARSRLRVITAQVDIPIDDLFSTRVATTTVPLPANTTARFSTTVPAALQRGLRNVAGRLADGSLTANTTVMLALDLTPYGGGHDAYRFTRLDLGRLGNEILIERQGTIGHEGLFTDERRALRARFDRLGFSVSGFSDDEFEQVLIGLGEIPEAQLSSMRGLRFGRAPRHHKNPDAAAQYEPLAHRVLVFDRAYSSGMMRMGRAGRPLRFAAHAVAHEVGHALDLSSLRTTAANTTAAESALRAAFPDPRGGFEIPDVRDPRRAQFDPLHKAFTDAQTAERAARSLSGARWTTGDPAEVTDDPAAGAQQRAGARQPAFRQAVLDDGGSSRMPTTYPNPESIWQEYFAESFALYQTSPALLRRMRPHVFAFMSRQFR